MLSFKEYLAHYPSENNAKLLSVEQRIQKDLAEAKNPYVLAPKPEGSQVATMSKRDLIQMIADQDCETVLVKLNGEGIYFEFVQPKFEERDVRLF